MDVRESSAFARAVATVDLTSPHGSPQTVEGRRDRCGHVLQLGLAALQRLLAELDQVLGTGAKTRALTVAWMLSTDSRDSLSIVFWTERIENRVVTIAETTRRTAISRASR